MGSLAEDDVPIYKRRRRDGTLAQTYTYDFRYSGRRFSGDTGATSRRQAEAVERDARLTATTATIEADAPLTFRAAASRYWNEHGQHLRMAPELWSAIAWLERQIGPDTRFDAITDDTVARLVAKRRGERRRFKTRKGYRLGDHVSPAGVNRSVTDPLRMIHERVRKVWKRPVATIDWRRHRLAEPQERVREASRDEQAAIEAHAAEGYAEAIAFALISGMRFGEVVSLTWPRVNLLTGELRVTGKGNRTRTVPITDALRAILLVSHGHDPLHVFTYPARRTYRPKRGEAAGRARVRGQRYPITHAGLQSHWKRLRLAAGVADLRFHDLRHTAATRLLRASGNLRLAQVLLGHANIATTTKYAHAMLDDLRAGMEAADAHTATQNATPSATPLKRGAAKSKP